MKIRSPWLRQAAIFGAFSFFAILPLHAQDKPDQAGKKKEDQDKKDETAKENEQPKLTVTEHTVTIGGKPVKYKATAGYMVLKDYAPKPDKKKGDDEQPTYDQGGGDDNKEAGKKDKEDKDKPKKLARVFFIAYTRDDAGPPGKRPVTYCFNGGPGSASVWLHMGALGRAALS